MTITRKVCETKHITPSVQYLIYDLNVFCIFAINFIYLFYYKKIPVIGSDYVFDAGDD